jgi:hypothetical protein
LSLDPQNKFINLGWDRKFFFIFPRSKPKRKWGGVSVAGSTMFARMRIPLGAVVAIAFLGGCQHPHTLPDDPIFAGKQPTLSQPKLMPPSVAAAIELEEPVGPLQPFPRPPIIARSAN